MRSVQHIPVPIREASVSIDGANVYSNDYGDIYFSKAGGIAESEHVYIDGNHLSERFADCKQFVLGELGFGIGLNFLLTLRRWRECSRSHARLFYLAYELNPIPKEKLSLALRAQFGEDPLIDELVSKLPLPIEGLHVIRFLKERATLFLFLGDASDKLLETEAQIDAWFLDGFSPEKNPKLWSEDLLRTVSKLSYNETTASTYSVASAVREKLQNLGWQTEKVSGTGGKRHVLRARYLHGTKVGQSRPKSISVIGGGIAGASIGEALTRRGVAVTLFEANGIASAASGNSRAVVFPYLSAERDRRHRFYVTGFQYFVRLLEELSFEWTQCGVFYHPFRERQEKMVERIAEFSFPSDFAEILNQKQASELADVTLEFGGISFPQGGHLRFSDLCHQMLQGCEIIFEDRKLKEEEVILATGANTEILPEYLRRSIVPVKGEVLEIIATEKTQKLRIVLCGDGYVLPESNKKHLVGATYYRGIADLEPTKEGAEELSGTFKSFFPSETTLIDSKSLRAGVRATTYDRLPFVGTLGEGMWISIGHGSRGGVSAPLSAEVLAASVCGEPLPIEKSILRGISVDRIKLS